MTKQPPASDAELIDKLGVEVVSKTTGRGTDTVNGWRKRGVPKRFQRRLTKMAEELQPSLSAPVEDSVSADDSVIERAERVTSTLQDLGTFGGAPTMPVADEPTSSPEEGEATPGEPTPVESQSEDRDDRGDADHGHAAERQEPRVRSVRRRPAARIERYSPPAPNPTVERVESQNASVNDEPIQKKKPVRLNRQAVLIVCAAIVSGVGIGLINGLNEAGSTTAIQEPKDDLVAPSQSFVTLPNISYADVTRPKPPELTTAALTVAKESPPPVEEVTPEPVVVQQVVAAGPAFDEEDEAALQSALFPRGASAGGGGASGSSGASGVSEGVARAQAALDQLRGSLPSAADLAGGGLGGGGLSASGGGNQNQSFLDAQLDETIYLKNGLQKPLSDYEIKAGSIIPAALITGLNSDLPGEIIGQVTEHVYDSVSGNHLLIPQGAKIFGRYNDNVGYGQERAQIVWDRLIMPNGNSVQLEAMIGTDKAGYAGLAGEVDNHLGRLAGAIILSSIIGVGANLATDSGGDVVDALGDSAAQQAAQVGSEIVGRQLEVQPTLTVRPGFKLNILVNKDMILEPYEAS